MVDLSVDLKDVIGDRLFLSKGFRRDGVRLVFRPCAISYPLSQTVFDIGQATTFKCVPSSYHEQVSHTMPPFVGSTPGRSLLARPWPSRESPVVSFHSSNVPSQSSVRRIITRQMAMPAESTAA